MIVHEYLSGDPHGQSSGLETLNLTTWLCKLYIVYNYTTINNYEMARKGSMRTKLKLICVVCVQLHATPSVSARPTVISTTCLGTY